VLTAGLRIGGTRLALTSEPWIGSGQVVQDRGAAQSIQPALMLKPFTGQDIVISANIPHVSGYADQTSSTN
jgi:hypothetical protein